MENINQDSKTGKKPFCECQNPNRGFSGTGVCLCSCGKYFIPNQIPITKSWSSLIFRVTETKILEQSENTIESMDDFKSKFFEIVGVQFDDFIKRPRIIDNIDQKLYFIRGKYMVTIDSDDKKWKLYDRVEKII